MESVTEDRLRVDVFCGDAWSGNLRVFARVEPTGLPDGCTLQGRLRGPKCRYARTLPHTVDLRDAGRGDSLMACGVLTEPCHWSPEGPYYYEAHIEVLCDGEKLIDVQQMFGVRPLGCHQRRLWYSGKNWVLRAAVCLAPEVHSLDAWRESATAMYVPHPGEPLCRAASEIGVMLFARLTGDVDHINDELRRVARWPAVSLAELEPHGVLPASVRSIAPNLPLAASPRACGSKKVEAWAHVVLIDVDDPLVAGARTKQFDRPVIAVRRSEPATSIAAARKACDRLQSDLARRGDFAGYIV